MRPCPSLPLDESLPCKRSIQGSTDPRPATAPAIPSDTLTTKTIAGQEHRFRAFQISERDLALLAALAGFARARLPSLLPQLHEQFAPWPEIAKALSQPQVHERRLAHWIRLASGDFGEGFTESARSLATAFHEHGVPIYAVVICHGIVVNALIAELGLDQRRLTSLSGRWRRTRLDTGIATRAALSKAAQFDLELLLETYALVEQDRRDATRRQIEAFEGTVRDVVGAVGSGAVKVESLAATMEAVVGETSAQAFMAVRTADDASSNVSNVAAATNELSISLDHVAAEVVRASELAHEADAAAQQTDAIVQSLSRSANTIGSVVELIQMIASQTNLLALNATIEAARAGEAGRGFAVVATEVKQLSARTAQATGEIAAQVPAMQAATREAVAALERIVAFVSQVSGIASVVAASIDEQRAATQEIARSAHQAAVGTEANADAIGKLSTRAQEAGNAVSEVLGVAGALSRHAAGMSEAFETLIRQSRAVASDRKAEPAFRNHRLQ